MNDYSNVLALSGHDGTGKSTTARTCIPRLVTDTPHPVYGTVPLAEALRVEASRHLNLPVNRLFEKPTPDHLRAYMRALGWTMRVEHGPEYWLRRWDATVSEVEQDNGLPGMTYLVDDVRHLNEAEWFTTRGACLICLVRQDTEPERTPDLPPIIEEVFQVRERAALGQLGSRASVLDLTGMDPEQVTTEVLRRFVTSRRFVPPASPPTL